MLSAVSNKNLVVTIQKQPLGKKFIFLILKYLIGQIKQQGLLK